MQTFYTQQLAMPLASSSDILHVHTKTINWLNWIPQYYVFILKTWCFATVLSPVDKYQEARGLQAQYISFFSLDGAQLLVSMDNLWCDVIGRVLMKFWEFGKKRVFFVLKQT